MATRDWYARRLGQDPRAVPPATPPAYPGRPDNQYGQQTHTDLQRAQQMVQNQRQAADESLAMARQGQGNMMELASHYQGSKAANNATGMCPNCGEGRYIKPGPSYMAQCYHCGYNERFQVFGA